MIESKLFVVEYRYRGQTWATVIAADSAWAAEGQFKRNNPTVEFVGCLVSEDPARLPTPPADAWLEDRAAMARAALYFGSSSAVRASVPPSASSPTPPAIPEIKHITAADIPCPTDGCAGISPAPIAPSWAAAGAAGEGWPRVGRSDQ